MKSFATFMGILAGCTIGFLFHSFLAALWWGFVTRQLLIVLGKIITAIIDLFRR